MNTIKNKLLVLFSVISISLFSCADLTVENLNQPDTERALASSSDLVTLAEGLYRTFYTGLNSYGSLGMGTAVLADAATCSWGNQGMQLMGTEPRPAWDNAPNYSYQGITNNSFNLLYSINSSATDVLKALDSGIDFGSDAKRIEALAKFMQGLSTGYIAMVFDQAYIVDENTTSEELSSPTLVPYSDIMDHAISKLVAAATIAKANSFTISESVINTPGGLSNDQFAQVIHAFAARFMANVARTKAERSAVDWAAVQSHVANAIDSDFNIHNDAWETGFWYNEMLVYLTYPGWARVDMRLINMMDDSYVSWSNDGLNHPAPDSARIADVAEVDDRLWSDYSYLSSNNFRPERGLYFFSNFRFTKHAEYIGAYDRVLPQITLSEMHMLHAEALVQQGKVADAAAIVNDPAGARTVRGGLPAVAATADAVMKAIHHERMIEQYLTGKGNEWMDMRGMDMLQAGSPLHFPLPAKILETLGYELPFYTFGGVGGPGASTGGWR